MATLPREKPASAPGRWASRQPWWRTSAIVVATWATLGSAGALAAPRAVAPDVAALAGLETARERAALLPQRDDVQFDLVMAYARTPFLEEGWRVLRRLQGGERDYAPRVVERYQAAILAMPEDAESHFRLAFGFYFTGNREAARQQLEWMVQLAPGDPAGFEYLGILRAEENRLDLAITAFRRAIQLDSLNPVTHYVLGQTLYRQGHFAPALHEISEALKLRATVIMPLREAAG